MLLWVESVVIVVGVVGGTQKERVFFVGKSSFVASAAFAIWFHGTRISAHLEFVFN